MKTVIRKGVFETNSSSTHSITITNKFSNENMKSMGVDEFVAENDASKKLAFAFAYISKLEQEQSLELSKSEEQILKEILLFEFEKKSNTEITIEEVENLIFYYYDDIEYVPVNDETKLFFEIFTKGKSKDELHELIKHYFKSKCFLVDIEND